MPISPRGYGSPTATNSPPSGTRISHRSMPISPPAHSPPPPPVRGPESGIGQGLVKRGGRAMPAGAVCSARVNRYSPMPFFICTWGEVCTCRSSPLLGAHLRHISEWRRPPYTVRTNDFATYVQIITWFLDSPLPQAPFSVHRMALAGKDLGKDVGQWFGPSTAAGAIK
jgi:hypothetical protein